MDDGVAIAATFYIPDGAPPAGGWPAIVFLHGLSGNRQQMNALVESYGFTGGSYVILTFDARGHGASGGLVGIDGPREVADTRAVLRLARGPSGRADTKIGAWGISYGGGAVFNSLVAGVPWAAVTRRDLDRPLHRAHAAGAREVGARRRPRRLDPGRKRDPAAERGTGGGLRRQRLPRSTPVDGRPLQHLHARRGATPIFLVQGRRDFLFGIDQGTTAFARLKGPKVLYIGTPRPRALDVPGGGHRLPPVRGCAPGSTATCAASGLRRGPGVRVRGDGEVRRPGRTSRGDAPARVADRRSRSRA